jgi:hypothetical protein
VLEVEVAQQPVVEVGLLLLEAQEELEQQQKLQHPQ